MSTREDLDRIWSERGVIDPLHMLGFLPEEEAVFFGHYEPKPVVRQAGLVAIPRWGSKTAPRRKTKKQKKREGRS